MRGSGERGLGWAPLSPCAAPQELTETSTAWEGRDRRAHLTVGDLSPVRAITAAGCSAGFPGCLIPTPFFFFACTPTPRELCLWAW